MATNDDFMNAVQKLESELAAQPAAIAVPSKGEICRIYHLLKPILDGLLPFIEKIPVWGKRVADGIRLLMKLLDAFCG